MSLVIDRDREGGFAHFYRPHHRIIRSIEYGRSARMCARHINLVIDGIDRYRLRMRAEFATKTLPDEESTAMAHGISPAFTSVVA